MELNAIYIQDSFLKTSQKPIPMDSKKSSNKWKLSMRKKYSKEKSKIYVKGDNKIFRLLKVEGPDSNYQKTSFLDLLHLLRNLCKKELQDKETQ